MNNHDGNQIVQVRSYGSSKKLLTLKAWSTMFFEDFDEIT